MHTIGVGLIGMGKCHALGRDTPVVRRVMLCEVDEDLARRRADEFGLDTATADWRAVIADPEVDVVSIAAPNALHAPMAIAALEAGKRKVDGARARRRRGHGDGGAGRGPGRHPRL
jgi:predicted dehydrogenase